MNGQKPRALGGLKCIWPAPYLQDYVVVKTHKMLARMEAAYIVQCIITNLISLYHAPINVIQIYTTLTNFSKIYLVMCKVYTDVGGIK